MRSRIVGGILLITGTSIGAGMLGLPIAAAQLGFIGSLLLLLLCWFVTISSAFLILEVNLWLPQNNNLITMARASIGPMGQLVAWLAYLLLLYSLLCAYIAGGSDLFHILLQMVGLDLPTWIASIVFTLLFGTVVYLGMISVDKTNRVLMGIKFGTFVILILLLMPLVSTDKLADGHLYYLTSVSAITVTVTAFGWGVLVPSLRVYFSGDLKKLKRVILIGSLIPLICYIVWDAVIMGIIPLRGEDSLEYILHANNSTGHLVRILNSKIERHSMGIFIKLFTSVCVLTSFLGVALCLTDFLADGLHLVKKGVSNLFIHLLTFLPALGIAIFFPNMFIKALEYAGIYATVLLILLPAWMAWSGRYRKGIASGFQVPGGKILLLLILIFSISLILRGLTNAVLLI